MFRFRCEKHEARGGDAMHRRRGMNVLEQKYEHLGSQAVTFSFGVYFLDRFQVN